MKTTVTYENKTYTERNISGYLISQTNHRTSRASFL